MQKRACKAASASSEFQLRHLCHLSQLLPLVTSKGIAIVMLRTLLMETGCLCSQATPFFMASSSKVPPSFLPAHSYGYRAGGWQTELGDVLHHFPSHGCQHGSQDQSPISSPCSPPGDCSWGSPEKHGEGVPLSEQMAPAPSLPSAALLFSGGTMAFCLPSHGLWGAPGTAWHWGAQATAKTACTGWRETRVRMSLAGYGLQPPNLGWRGGKPPEDPPKLPSNPAELLFWKEPSAPGVQAAGQHHIAGCSPALAHPR